MHARAPLVVSAGDSVGIPDRPDFAGVSPLSGPELIGHKVTFGKYAGVALFPKRETVGGSGYESRFVCLTDGDILFHHHEIEE